MLLDMIFASIAVGGSMKLIESLERLPDLYQAMKKDKTVAYDIVLVVLFIVGFILWVATVIGGKLI